ncbi:hypothetical protein FOZ60_012087 [Perkinsus olseni]|uniref:Uncharacterized protein n=1 Tax=Perkinsus olseni TaxID=32597 RepID=A0A7J6NC77_PEROL|nr:hypothetical protein FOZ60_012087 [Perkinsus olseni]
MEAYLLRYGRDVVHNNHHYHQVRSEGFGRVCRLQDEGCMGTVGHEVYRYCESHRRTVAVYNVDSTCSQFSF